MSDQAAASVITARLLHEAIARYYTRTGKAPSAFAMHPVDYYGVLRETLNARVCQPTPRDGTVRFCGALLLKRPSVPMGTAVVCEEDGTIPQSAARIL